MKNGKSSVEKETEDLTLDRFYLTSTSMCLGFPAPFFGSTTLSTPFSQVALTSP
jgi:hypothetical protein